MIMLIIEELQVELNGKVLLKDINLEIGSGETHILFGPNGSGKTSLLMCIMGYPNYVVKKGKVTFNGIDITRAPIDERARLGIGMSFQRPPTIHGVKTRQIVEICAKRSVDAEAMARSLNFEEFLDRDVNAGFSGGEIKRSELLQLKAQNPELMLFDEPESGVDMENMALIGTTIAAMLQKDGVKGEGESIAQKRKHRTKMGLIITHTGYILDYVPADRGQVLYAKTIACSGNPLEIFQCIGKRGYEECIACER
jgi:Fe-S cluster assembly ATP-binding protein